MCVHHIVHRAGWGRAAFEAVFKLEQVLIAVLAGAFMMVSAVVGIGALPILYLLLSSMYGALGWSTL